MTPNFAGSRAATENSTLIQILNEVALILVLRKRVSFQDRKNENTPKFPSIKISY